MFYAFLVFAFSCFTISGHHKICLLSSRPFHAFDKKQAKSRARRQVTLCSFCASCFWVSGSFSCVLCQRFSGEHILLHATHNYLFCVKKVGGHKQTSSGVSSARAINVQKNELFMGKVNKVIEVGEKLLFAIPSSNPTLWTSSQVLLSENLWVS